MCDRLILRTAPRMLRAILFDLDNTLYDLQAHWTACLRAALAQAAAHTRHDLEALVHAALQSQTWINQLPAFLRTQGISDPTLIAMAHTRYREIWFDTLTLDPDAPALLAELGARYRLALVTNGPSWSQRPKIERFGLATSMQVILVSEEVGIAKPDPAIFSMALDALAVQPGEALFVGDSPEHDLCGAAAAGIPAIWVNRHRLMLPPAVPPPLATVDRLCMLADLIARYDA